MKKSEKKNLRQTSTTKDERERLSSEASKEVMCETRRRMEESNLGLTRGLSKLDQLLEATKPIAATVIRKAGKDKDAHDADSATTDFIEVPDNQAQAKALDMLLSLGDYYPDKKFKGTVNVEGSIMAAVAARLGEKK
jgi:hypothetical protein